MSDSPNGKFTIPIADYRWKYVLYAMVCWGLVIAGFLTFGAKERHWQFWMAEVVMLLFGSGVLYMLLNNKYEFIGKRGVRYDAWMNQKYDDMLHDEGHFVYNEEGFVFKSEPEDITVIWTQISKISAHLENQISNDDNIVLRLDFGQNHFIEFDEEVNGWLKFLSMMQEKFPDIHADWQGKLLSSEQKELELFTSQKE